MYQILRSTLGDCTPFFDAMHQGTEGISFQLIPLDTLWGTQAQPLTRLIGLYLN